MSKHTTEPVAWPPLEKDVRARIVNLYNNPRAWTPERLNALLDAVSALAASAAPTAIAEDVRDAQRYRWLRDQSQSFGMGIDTPAEHTLVFLWQQAKPEEASWSFDDAIDAAMLSTPKD